MDGVRERLGITRALRVELYTAKLNTESSIKNEVVATGTVLPIQSWEAHGHKLLGALKRPGEIALIETFGRFGSINAIVAASQRPEGALRLKPGKLELGHLAGLLGKIDRAIELMDGLEGEYQERELRLRWPVRSRMPEKWPGALRLEKVDPDPAS